MPTFLESLHQPSSLPFSFFFHESIFVFITLQSNCNCLDHIAAIIFEYIPFQAFLSFPLGIYSNPRTTPTGLYICYEVQAQSIIYKEWILLCLGVHFV